MKNNLFKKAMSILAGIAALCTLMPMEPVHAAAEDIPDRMEMVASNDQLELYLDKELADLAIKVKATGDVWFTNPQGADEDTQASNYYKGLMKSQFSIRYYNESVQSSEMDSYADAVAEGQFSIDEIPNGVKINYNLGDVADKFVLPQIISAERYEYYTGLMDAKDAKSTGRNYLYLNTEELSGDKLKEYLEQYPILEEYPIYVLKDSVKDYKKEELTEYFQGVGYTVQEMEQDNLDNGYESVSQKAWFNISVSYYLDGDAFIAEIDPGTVEYDMEKYYLVDIDLLEYFGAGGSWEDGYLFVPDGCGALVNYNNGKLSTPDYIGYVYGEDKTNQVNLARKPEIDQSVTVRMPVFGAKKGDSAFFAIVEDGEAGADINAAVAGRTDSYNHVYAGFGYLSYGAISLGDMVGSNSFQMYSPPVFDGNFKVRYCFLNGEEADYAGMAACYQEYLLEQGILNGKVEGDGAPFYIDFIGAIQKWKSILGIKVRTTQELTTYEQAAEAVRQLTEGGVEGIKVEYSGWSSGGLHGTAPGKTKALSCLKTSKMGLEDFQQEMAEAGIPVFHTAQLQYVYNDMFFDGYRSESHAPRYYDNTAAQTNDYLIPNGMKDRSSVIDMISPGYVEKMADTFLKKTAGYHLAGISVENLACDLFSDFNSRNYIDRQAAAGRNGAAMAKLAESSSGNLLGSNANVYAWQYLSDIKEVPLDSNRSQLIDEVIPFYEMVIHGYRDYTGEPVNLSGDVNTMILKSIEAGAGISFEWICGDNSLLKNTKFDHLYSVGFQDWKETAIQSWQRVNEAVGSLRSVRITGHEKLAEGVTCTEYENGVKVIVNYNKYEVKYEGSTVKAQDFLVVKEE